MPGESGALHGRLEAMKAKFGEMRSGLKLNPIFRQNPTLPRDGVVRDSETAIRIAEAIWSPLYGADLIERQKPLKAELKYHVVWIVSGSTTKQGEEPLSAFILKADGRILAVGSELPAAEAAS